MSRMGWQLESDAVMLLRPSCPPISVTSLIGGFASFLPPVPTEMGETAARVSQPVQPSILERGGLRGHKRHSAGIQRGSGVRVGWGSYPSWHLLRGIPPCCLVRAWLSLGHGNCFVCTHGPYLAVFAALNTPRNHSAPPGLRKRQIRIGAGSSAEPIVARGPGTWYCSIDSVPLLTSKLPRRLTSLSNRHPFCSFLACQLSFYDALFPSRKM